MTVVTNEELRKRLRQEIDAANAQHRMNPDIMFLVEALKEIERLNLALTVAGQQSEDLFRFINEHRGDKVEVIHQMRSDDVRPKARA